jgi:hypothetical protein
MSMSVRDLPCNEHMLRLRSLEGRVPHFEPLMAELADLRHKMACIDANVTSCLEHIKRTDSRASMALVAAEEVRAVKVLGLDSLEDDEPTSVKARRLPEWHRLERAKRIYQYALVIGGVLAIAQQVVLWLTRMR